METQSIMEYLNAVENINEVYELTINRFDISGNIIPVDMNDLRKFNHLEKLTICNMPLNENDMMIISKLNKINSLEFYNCELIFDDLISYINQVKLSKLLVDNTLIEFNYINSVIDRVIVKNVDLNENIKCNVLDVHQASVNFEKIDLLNYERIIICNKQYLNNQILFDNVKGKIHITVMSDDYDNIEVEYEKDTD